MKKIYSLYSVIVFLFATALVIYACNKGGGNAPPPNPCTGVTITVNGSVTNPSAPGASDGSITATGSGSSGFTFSLNGGAFQASGTFTGLAAGTYTITAKNANGCTGSNSFTLSAPNPCAGVTINVNGTVTNPTNTATNNGSIAASASGGTAPYTFSLNGGAFQASGTFSNLGVGTFTITAKDINGCTGSAIFTLTAPNPCAGVTITVNGTVTNPTTPSSNNGSIAASATGGTAPYSFSLNGGAFQSSGTFSNLGQGSFTVTARDANNCTGSAVFTLTAPNPCAGVTITVSNAVVNNIPCQAASGSITVTPSGGTGPYTFQLNSGAFQSSNVFSSLAAGTYSVTAKDVNGCTGSGNATVIDQPAGPLFTAVRDLIQTNCVSCHNAGNPNGGMIFTIDCNIVINKDRINARAVNGTGGPMPPSGLLPASERQKITNWINAGGRFTD
jgi:hypothetical protein